MHAAAVLALLAAAWSTWRCCSRVLRPGSAGLVSLIAVLFLLYASALIPGAIGQLTAGWMAGMLIVLAAATAVVFGRLARTVPPAGLAAASTGPVFDSAALAASILGLLGLAPILMFCSDLPWRFREAALVLEWDTVSYHLPALIEFLQQRTLWYLGGAYSSYSYGYELLAALPVACFHGSWPLVPVHILGLLLFLLAMYVASRALCESVNAWLPRPVPPLAVFLLAAGSFSRMFAFEMGRVGKNDVFQAGCILATASCLLEYVRLWAVTGPALGRRLLLWAAAAALGLALATKPTSLVFLPGFAALVAVSGERAKRGPAGRGVVAGAWSAGALLIGGFFLFRNLWGMHRLVPADLTYGFEESLWTLLRQPDRWRLHVGSVIAVLGVLSMAVGVVCVRRARAAGTDTAAPLILLVVHGCALVAFMFTPFVVRAPESWYTRLGMPLFAVAALWFGLAGVSGLSAAAAAGGRVLLRGILFASLAVLALMTPRWMDAYRAIGLPGYESVRGLPPSNVYEFIQRLGKPVRVYAAGLRPLGLYGPEYANRVFYDLHSDVLAREPQGQARLTRILQSFHPQLIAISVDPHASDQAARKPLVEWMRRQPCFVEVFNDAAVSVFTIREGWQELLRQYPPEPGPLRMGG